MSDFPKYLNARYKNWKNNLSFEKKDIFKKLELVGQSPKSMIISCCDSRVNASMIFGAETGEFFIHRNIANLIPSYNSESDQNGTSAAIEFAVCALKVSHIIVLGHSQCGGIRSLMEGDHLDHEYGFIDPWMEIAESAKEAVVNDYADEDFDAQCIMCEKASIQVSLKNLKTFPWVKERYDAGNLFIHGWYFDIESGNLFCNKGEQFVPVKDLAFIS